MLYIIIIVYYYTDTWTCHLHMEFGLTSHTHIAPPSRPWSDPLTLSPPTPPTQPQPKHRGKAQAQSSHPFTPSPPTPPRPKHIHISHTPP